MNKKLFKILGNILMVVCLGFIIYMFTTFDIDYGILLETRVLIAALVSVVLLIIPVFLNSIAYYKILNMLGLEDDIQKEIINVYATSNIGKYLPGNVMHFAGRNIIGTRYNLSNRKLLTATFFEVGLKVIVAIIISIIFAFEYLVQVYEKGFNRYFVFIVAAVIVVVAAGMIITYRRHKDDILGNKKNIIKVVLIDLAIMIINIICIIIIALALVDDTQIIIANALPIAGIYVTSWLIGYLTPGAPGGVGVKEASMVFLLSGIMLESDILLIGVILRICSVLGDVSAFFINKLFNKMPGLQTQTVEKMD